jgi:tetratricopeptide (TPR) repeat protein
MNASLPFFSRLLLGTAALSLLAGCATPVAVPAVGPLAEPPAGSALTVPAGTAAGIEVPAAPGDFAKAWAPLKPGERLITGIVLTPLLADVLDLQGRGQLDEAVRRLATAPPPQDPLLRWYMAALRVHLLNLGGRASEAEAAVPEVARLEVALRGSDLVARALRGDARARLGDHAAAVGDYESVLAALGGWRFPTRYGGPPSNITDLSLTTEARSRALIGLAFTHIMAGQHGPALRWAAESERHLADVFSVSTHPLYGPFLGRMLHEAYLARAVNLAFMGSASLAGTGRDADAEPYFAAAQSAFAGIGFVHGAVYVDALKALAYLRNGRIDDADRTADRARRLAAERGLVDFVWRIEALRGEALFAGGRIDEAEQALRRAQDAVDVLTGAIRGDGEKRRFGIGKDDITYRLVQIGIMRNRPEALYRDLEKGRARAFVDLLANLAIDSPTGGWAELRALDARISGLVRSIEAGAGTGGGASPSLDGLMAQRADLLRRIRVERPELAETRAVPEPDPARLQAALADGEAMLYFLPARQEDALRVLLITRQAMTLQTLPTTAQALRAEIAELARAVELKVELTQQALAGRLSRALAAERWRGFRLIHVVPSGIVHSVPWGILDLDVPVVLAPTGDWPLRKRAAMPAQRAVVVGDPEFGGKLPQLPGARAEAASVARHYRTELLIGPAATETGLRQAIGGGTDVIHFATHGIFDARRPLRSAIYLAGAEPISAERLFASPLHGRLVVLSACETGIGTAEAGDDYLGLPRSLFLGGADAVLSSLWPVDDEGTRQFMERFHAERATGSAAQAWLAARNQLRAAGQLPWVYGAFMLSGTP